MRRVAWKVRAVLMTTIVEASEFLSSLKVLTPAIIQQIDEKLAEAVEHGYAIIELEVLQGKLRFIKGPAPSEPVRVQ